MERWKGPEEKVVHHKGSTSSSGPSWCTSPTWTCGQMFRPSGPFCGWTTSAQSRAQRLEPGPRPPTGEVVSGRPFPKSRPISSGPACLIATSITMTAYSGLVKDNRRNGWGERRLYLENSCLAHPAPIQERFTAARRKSVQILELCFQVWSLLCEGFTYVEFL